MGSTRLPGKVLRPILGRPMLSYIVERLRAASGVASVVVATSDQPGDEAVRAFCREESIDCFSGSELDVLDRFYRAAVEAGGDPLLRITGDCPLVDPELVTRLLAMYHSGRWDHVAVATGAGAIFLEGGRFPDGLDAECFGFDVLERAWREAVEATDREHVTPYIWRHTDLFRCELLPSRVDHSTMRWTVDNEEDFTLVAAIYGALYRPGRPFGMDDVLGWLSANPALAAGNRAFLGQEGYEDLWLKKP